MLVLGLVIVAAAVVLVAAVSTSNTDAVDTDLWGMHISNLSLGAVFAAGMVATAAAVLGIMLVLAGMRRGRRLRRERRALVRENARLSRRTEAAEAPAIAESRPDGRHEYDDAVADDEAGGRHASHSR